MRLTIASMSSTGLASSGMTPPTPALLTSKVMLASLRRICSTRSESALFVRSAATTSTVRPVWSLKCLARALSLPRLRATRIRS
ncbi:hypothetical protein D3C76_1436390 [compost metagenome]